MSLAIVRRNDPFDHPPAQLENSRFLQVLREQPAPARLGRGYGNPTQGKSKQVGRRRNRSGNSYRERAPAPPGQPPSDRATPAARDRHGPPACPAPSAAGRPGGWPDRSQQCGAQSHRGTKESPSGFTRTAAGQQNNAPTERARVFTARAPRSRTPSRRPARGSAHSARLPWFSVGSSR